LRGALGIVDFAAIPTEGGGEGRVRGSRLEAFRVAALGCRAAISLAAMTPSVLKE
jgi:hypothetical protein